MALKLYVGRLPYAWGDEDLTKLFADYGEVQSANIIIDREYNRSKGFGFVELADEEAGQKAIKELDGKEVDGREIVVNEARPKKDFGGERNYR